MRLKLLPIALLSLCITHPLPWGLPMYAQEVTASAHPASAKAIDTRATPANLPEDPAAEQFPDAIPVPRLAGRAISIQSETQTKKGDLYSLKGNVDIETDGYLVHADSVEYNAVTGDVKADGHLRLVANSGQQTISASRGEFNLRTQTGSFHDVLGSIGVRGSLAQRPGVYTSGDPFLFSGRIVAKTGPESFEIYDGTITSCQLPRPDWQFSAGHFTIRDGKATARNTKFRLLNVPVLWLPYASHPTDPEVRQPGFFIPEFRPNVTKKGTIIREQFYLPLSRSMDLTIGADYYSQRGWGQNATFNYRGRDLNYFTGHYDFMLDRGFVDDSGKFQNQGGEYGFVHGRRDFSDHTRAAGSVEYLSSYVYREAFSDNFNEAVTSDIVSTAYMQHDRNGYIGAVHADRYQGIKNVTLAQDVRIFHAPSLDFDSVERHIGSTPLVWSSQNSLSVLKRVQPNFRSDVSTRLDFRPQISLPVVVRGWNFRPGFAFRDTFYQHRRRNTPLPGSNPVEVSDGINRAMVEANFEMRPPTLERTFETGVLSRFLGREVKHTIEPAVRYIYRSGTNGDFNRYLRFDETDVVSDTNEVEVSITQRLFLRPAKQRPCDAAEAPAEDGTSCGGTRESFLWRINQKRFFDTTFGEALNTGRRNVLQTTLDFSGVAFLTDKRSTSPIQSQMRLSATDRLDIEWDINYDTHAGKFTQSNTFINYHFGNYFGGIAHARLNAPGRAQTGNTVSATSNFSQLRFQVGYGDPLKPGLAIATMMGLNLPTIGPTAALSQSASLQYGAVQGGYNWRCCGISAEYRHYELGSIRQENAYKFNFTLANIASVGNLRRIDRLF